MNDAVLVALISGLCVAVPTMVTTLVSSYQNKTLNEYRFNELQTDFKTLREKVEKHNGIVERTSILEIETKTIFKRLDEIKSEIHEMNEYKHS